MKKGVLVCYERFGMVALQGGNDRYNLFICSNIENAEKAIENDMKTRDYSNRLFYTTETCYVHDAFEFDLVK